MDKYTIAPPAGSTNNSVGAEDRPWHEGHFGSVKLNGGDLGGYLAESTGYGIVSGCEPSISGLTVTVGAGVVHLADGTRKEIAETNITLDAADSTNPRIDLVYIDSTGAVAKITGTAAASPVVPDVPTGGISVANVSVAAGATTGTLTDKRGILPRWYNTGIVNVKDYGAVGDGAHDDTAAFRVAISTANNCLIVPEGDYLITDNLFADINVKDKGNYPNIKPAYRWKDLLIKNFAGFGRANTITQTDSTVHPQGMTYDTKRDVLICAMVKSDDSAQSLLTINPSTYTVTATNTYSELGHVNSLAYCPDTDKIYSVKFIGGSAIGSPYVAVVNASTMTYEETINVPQTLGFLDYDEKCKCFVGGNWTEADGRIAQIYIWDKNWNLLKQFTVSKEPQQTRYNGSILAFNGHAILIGQEGLIEFDYFGNVIQRTEFTLGYQQGMGVEYELEDIATDGNGNIYINVPHLVVGEATKIKIYKYNAEIDANNGDFSMISRGGAIFVPDNTDLNYLTDPGIYMVQMTAPGSADCHFPKGRTYALSVRNGLLQVMGEGANNNYIYLRQIFYERNNPGLIYERRYLKGYEGNIGWTPWIELTHTIQSRMIGPFTVGASSQKNYKVTFGTAFEGVPTVVAIVNGITDFIISTSNITSTGFKFSIKNTASESKTCYVSWIAVNPTYKEYGEPSYEEA